MTRVVVVDDEESIRALLEQGLTQAGYQVTTSESAEAAAPHLKDADLVILDVMLPGENGTETAEKLRQDGNQVPVVFLTAKDTLDDKLTGLSLGDDYVTKPFAVDELIARVQAVLRRRNPDRRTIQIGEIHIDLDGHQVQKNGETIELSRTEYALLTALAETPGNVVTKQDILQKVWKYDFGGATGIVDTYVSYLRRKLDPEHRYIHTVRGVGHVLRDNHKSDTS